MQETQPNRPVIFIGSSKEGLTIANALQVNLDRQAEVIVWSQGVFGLSNGTLESLEDQTGKSDFAIMVLTPDDLILSRENETYSPRDNVVFELGLFMGTLGHKRTFIVYDRTANIKLPSDLAGLTSATFQPPSVGNFESALGAASATIRSSVQSLGNRERSGKATQIDQNTQFRVIAGLLEPSAVQFIILMHEIGAKLHRETSFIMGTRYEYATYDEHHHGTGNGFFGVAQFCMKLADAEILTIDLRGQVSLTDRGHQFAKWLIDAKLKANYFSSEIGTWGERPKNMNPFPAMPSNIFEAQQQ